MPLDLSEIALDADLGQAVTIIRSGGFYGPGGWQSTPPQLIPAWGIVCVANDKALQMVPEGDRVTGALQFITTAPIFTTQVSTQGTSDQIQWGGNYYRVASVGAWIWDGYFSAILLRMKGA